MSFKFCSLGPSQNILNSNYSSTSLPPSRTPELIQFSAEATSPPTVTTVTAAPEAISSPTATAPETTAIVSLCPHFSLGPEVQGVTVVSGAAYNARTKSFYLCDSTGSSSETTIHFSQPERSVPIRFQPTNNFSCDVHIRAGFFTPNFGAIFQNFWHQIIQHLQPMFWVMHAAENWTAVSHDSSQFSLFVGGRNPCGAAINRPCEKERANVYIENTVCPHTTRAMVEDVYLCDDVNDTSDEKIHKRGYGLICMDRLYVRKNCEWNPDVFASAVIPVGYNITYMQWEWRKFMLGRFHIDDVPPVTPIVLWISRKYGTYAKHILNEEEIFPRIRAFLGDKAELRVTHFEKIDEIEQARQVASSIMVCANRGASGPNFVYLKPGAVVLYMGATGFNGIISMDALWFKVVRYDASTLPANSNWENYSIPVDEFMGKFESAWAQRTV